MARAKKKNSSGSKWLLILLVIAGIGGAVLYKVFGPNTGNIGNQKYLYVHTGATYEQVIESLDEGGYVADMTSFKLVANAMKFPEKVHAGKYKIKSGMSSFDMVRMLRSGMQEPVRLVINKLRTQQDFVRLIGTSLEADSTNLKSLMNDATYLSEFGVTPATAMVIVMPDTYEFFWNTNADKALRKIYKNHVRFWNDERKSKAKAQGVTPIEATIIASIVEEETNMKSDKPKIASVYLNRVRKGMKLQADPTVKFGIGDFAIRRVTSAMLQHNSPYNTYMYAGLPPGPICTPSPSSINAVIDAPRTTYLYFCAKDDFSGYSAFASNYEEQIKNAIAYRRALDKRNIH